MATEWDVILSKDTVEVVNREPGMRPIRWEVGIPLESS